MVAYLVPMRLPHLPARTPLRKSDVGPKDLPVRAVVVLQRAPGMFRRRTHVLPEAVLNSLPFPTRAALGAVDADGLPADCPARGEPPGFCPKLDLLSMVNALTEGILVCDGQRRVTYANPSAARLLGVPVADLIGRTLPQVVLSAVD